MADYPFSRDAKARRSGERLAAESLLLRRGPKPPINARPNRTALYRRRNEICDVPSGPAYFGFTTYRGNDTLN